MTNSNDGISRTFRFFLLMLISFVNCPAMAEQIMCPIKNDGRALRWFGVYDGFVWKLASMEGDENGWPVIYPGSNKEGFYAKCVYDRDPFSNNYRSYQIPKNFTHCIGKRIQNTNTIVCQKQ